jgi:hypothetical protein
LPQIQKADHEITGLELGGFRAGRDDFASNVATRDIRKIRTHDEPQLALTNLPIDWINTRGAHAYKNLIGVRSWLGQLTQMQLINAAVVVDDDCFHSSNSRLLIHLHRSDLI